MLLRFFRNATFNIIADFSNRISNAVVIILISKYLTVSQFGSYNLGTTYLSFGVLLSFWGYGNLLTREVAKEPRKFEIYFLNFGVMRLFFSNISFILIFFLASIFNYSQVTITVILIFSTGILAEAFKNLAYSAFNAFENTVYVSVVFFSSSLFKLIISYYLVRNNYGINELAWANTIINYIGAFVLVFLVQRYLPPVKFKLDWKFCVQQTRLAVPLFLIAILSISESRLDVIILSGYYSAQIVGLYSAALVLQGGLLIIPDGIRNAIFPVLAKNALSEPDDASKVYLLLFKYLTLISLATAAGSIVLAPKLIPTIYDDSFRGSIDMFRILMLSYPFYSLVILNIRFLNAYHKDILVVKFFAIDMVITIILSLIIVPLYGGVGAALIKVFTTCILYILFISEIYKLLPRIKIRGIILRGILSTIIMVVILIVLRDAYLLVNIIVGMIVFALSLLFMKTIGEEEREIFRSLIWERKKC